VLKDVVDRNALGGLLFEHSRNQVLRIRADLEPPWLIKVYLPEYNVPFHFIFVHGHKRNNTREDHVHHYTKTPDVCRMPVREAKENFWRTIG
jgi:hypothetical protein